MVWLGRSDFRRCNHVPKGSRNDLCPCRSGKRHQWCCGGARVNGSLSRSMESVKAQGRRLKSAVAVRGAVESEGYDRRRATCTEMADRAASVHSNPPQPTFSISYKPLGSSQSVPLDSTTKPSPTLLALSRRYSTSSLLPSYAMNL
jgi:hypothetical protein